MHNFRKAEIVPDENAVVITTGPAKCSTTDDKDMPGPWLPPPRAMASVSAGATVINL